MRRIFLTILVIFCTLAMTAQRHEIMSDHIATLQVVADNDWLTPGGPLWALRLWRAVRRGEISRAELERNARELLRGLGGLKDDDSAASR